MLVCTCLLRCLRQRVSHQNNGHGTKKASIQKGSKQKSISPYLELRLLKCDHCRASLAMQKTGPDTLQTCIIMYIITKVTCTAFQILHAKVNLHQCLSSSELSYAPMAGGFPLPLASPGVCTHVSQFMMFTSSVRTKTGSRRREFWERPLYIYGETKGCIILKCGE
jgi:hypothetical protein